MSPSRAAQLLANFPSAIRATNRKWVWRSVLVIGLPLLVFGIYLFSLGPVLRLYGAKPPGVWDQVPRAIRLIYQPTDRIPFPEPLGRLFRRYNHWCMGLDRDKREFYKFIEQIDGSITNGMAQADVLRFLGQPVVWLTNADIVEANYVFSPHILTYYGEYITNGFVISFSNEIVLRKSPVTGSFR